MGDMADWVNDDTPGDRYEDRIGGLTGVPLYGGDSPASDDDPHSDGKAPEPQETTDGGAVVGPRRIQVTTTVHSERHEMSPRDALNIPCPVCRVRRSHPCLFAPARSAK